MVKSQIQTEIRDRMKAKGLRITPQRFAVYANLLSRIDHPTVEEILDEINCDLPVSSKASVYSALGVLQDTGLVKEVLLEAGVTRYDANIDPHHHFVCECCGKIMDLDWDTFSHLSLNQLPSGLTGETYEVIIKGKCDRCQEAGE